MQIIGFLFIMLSDYRGESYIWNIGEQFYFLRKVARPQSEMVGGARGAPAAYKFRRAAFKRTSRVCIAGHWDIPFLRFARAAYHMKAPVFVARSAEKGYIPGFYAEFHRYAASRFPMELFEFPDYGFLFAYRDIVRPVVAYQHNIVHRIKRMQLRERTAAAHTVNRKHRHGGF